MGITENTRCAYQIGYIPNAKILCIVRKQPSNTIMLTCDAFCVLPPFSKLLPELASYVPLPRWSHFASLFLGVADCSVVSDLK